ncbi:MAG: hypothetical protein GWO24_14490, partial [Akkermansiaceae bacterium]|nr:hypothetical protein [Akkermansiaceae bacterium]
MVSIVSPPFIKSEPCRRAARDFWQAAEASGTLFVDEHPRLIKVQKAPILEQEVPNDLRGVLSRLMSFEFFEQELETGRIREFSEVFGERFKQRFHERIYDLSYEICQLLRILDQLNRNLGEGSA